MNVLVVLENNRGKLHRLSTEAIVGAQKLGSTVSALVMGEGLENIVNELEACDLEKIITVDHDLVSTYNADGYSEVVKQVAQSFPFNIILAGHTYQTRDFMPRVSAKLGIPFIPDIVSVNDNRFVKQVLNAKLNAEMSSASDSTILSFQSAAFNDEEIKRGSCSARAFDVKLDSSQVLNTNKAKIKMIINSYLL